MKRRLLCLCLVMSIVTGLFAAMPVSAASDMKASDSCIDIIKQFEGFSGTPYRDTDGLFTIGFGTRCPADMVEYYKETPMTREEAEVELRKEIVTYEKSVNAFIDRHGVTFSQQQFDAVVSLVYNVGPSWLTKGTTLIEALAGGATGNELIYAFTIYSMSGGNRSIGHVKRRLAEANVYLNGEYTRTLPDNFAYVIYNGQGGTVSSYNVQGYDTNLTAVPAVTASRDGYSFKGWYTDPAGGELVTVLDAATKNLTLHAQWEPLSGENPGVGPEIGETPEEKPEEPLIVTVTGNKVNVRNGAGLSYSVVIKIDSGEKLTITDVVENDGYTWGQFEKGWIALEYTDYKSISAKPCAHQYAVTAQKAPTCTAEGSVTYVCSLCGDSYTESKAATGHSYAAASCTSAMKCQLCGVTSGEPLGHDYTAATCTDAQTCKVCGVTSGEPLGHDYAAATCINAQTCKVCGVTSGEPLGHDYLDATCTSAMTCQSCGVTSGSALGHNYGKNGHCERCDAKDPDYKGPTITVTGVNVNLRSGAGLSYNTVGKVTAGDKLVITQTKWNDGYHWGKSDKGWVALKYTDYDKVANEVCKHDYSITAQVEPTCTNRGSVTYICNSCGLSYTDTVAAKGHDYSEATCIAASKCVTCGVTSGSALGHKYNSDGRCERCDAKDPSFVESESLVTVVKLYATVVNADTLHVRQSPNGTILSYLQRGDKVEIFEQQTVNGVLWGRCSKGWICLTTYGKLETATEQVSSDSLSGLTGVVKASTLVVRSGPGTKYEITHRLVKGTTIVILEKKASPNCIWARTNLGWVSMNHIDWSEAGVTTANSLVVRAGAGTKYAVVDRIPKGTPLIILEQKSTASVIWGKTEYGWVSMNHVRRVETGTVTASSLLVRAGAGTNYSVVDRLPKGTTVVILETKTTGDTTWARTSFGWVSMNYIK